MGKDIAPSCATPYESEKLADHWNLNSKSFQAEVNEKEKALMILSAIHFATSQLYCQGRINFSNQAAKFHLELAASQGHLEGQIILGKAKMDSYHKGEFRERGNL